MTTIPYPTDTAPPAEPAPPEPLRTPREIASTGLRTFPLAFDGSVLGWVAGEDEAAAVLDRFRGFGGTLISTADHYAAGRSELMVGKWLRTAPRDEVIVATKVGRHPDAPGVGAATLERAVEASLDRLRTDYIDILSFDGHAFPVDPLEALEAVDRLVRAGKVRFLGVAHVTAERVRDLQAMAEAPRFPTIQAVLGEYNLMRRRPAEDELIPAAADCGAAFIGLLPLAAGYLTGEIRTRDDVPSSPLFQGAVEHVGRRGTRILGALEEVAREHECSLAAIAIAWLLTKPGVTAAALRMRNPDALDEGMVGTSIPLTRQQLALLDDVSA